MRLRLSIAPVALAAILLAGCGSTANPAIGSFAGGYGAAAQAARKHAAPLRQGAPAQTKDQFVAAVKALGVSLTDADLAVLSKERAMVPNGQWASRPAANLTAAQNLTVHFQKHASQFHPSPASEQDYLNQAIATAEGKRGTIQFLYDTTSKAKGYQTHIIRYVPSTHELTCVRPDDGAMTTYYIDNGMSPGRYVEIPQF